MVISAALINTSLAILGCVLITECVFPLSYTKFGSQTRPKQGGALIIRGALMSARIRYLMKEKSSNLLFLFFIAIYDTSSVN